MDVKFKPLKASDVECRVAQVSKTGKGCSLLLYKDARCDMRQLDETVGPMNWQRKHEFKDGRLYCSVGIWDSDKEQWIWKEDVGSESNVEKDKGLASDAFKRAMFNWGCGRELYSAPFIWVKAGDVALDKYGDRYKTNDRFSVSEMDVDRGVITRLKIVNDRTKKVVFTYWGMKRDAQKIQKKTAQSTKNEHDEAQEREKPITEQQRKKIFATAKEIGMGEKELHIAIKTDSVSNLTFSKAKATIDWLERKKLRMELSKGQQTIGEVIKNSFKKENE